MLMPQHYWAEKYPHLSRLIKALERETFFNKQSTPETKAEYAERVFAEGLLQGIQKALSQKEEAMSKP